MIDKRQTGYLKEIEGVEWLAEVISERFDNALGMMSPYSVIYGGAVRDVIAEKELLGDLDIAVTPEAFGEMSAVFQENPRWVPHDPNRRGIIVSPKNSGDMARELAPMSNVSSFINMNGMVVQLITTNDPNKDRLQAAMYPAREVDIVCCGVIMLHDGRVFEVVEGAYDDCKAGILRLNETSETIYLDTLSSRVEKFVARGWKNQIDVDKAIKDIQAKRNKRKKLRKARSPMRHVDIDEVQQHMFINEPGSTPEDLIGGHMQEITRASQYGPVERLVDLIRRVSAAQNVNVRVVVSPLGQVYLECSDGHKCYRIVRELPQHKLRVESKPKKRVPGGGFIKGQTVTGRMSSSKPMISNPAGSFFEELDLPDRPKTKGGIRYPEGEVEVEFRDNEGNMLTKLRMLESQATKLKNGWENISDQAKAEILTKIAEQKAPPMKFKKTRR